MVNSRHDGGRQVAASGMAALIGRPAQRLRPGGLLFQPSSIRVKLSPRRLAVGARGRPSEIEVVAVREVPRERELGQGSTRSAQLAATAARSSVHNRREGKGGYPLLSTSNLYRPGGLRQAPGRAA
jgi:hypothetical protein